MWDDRSPEVEPTLLALETRSLNYWTAREVPQTRVFRKLRHHYLGRFANSDINVYPREADSAGSSEVYFKKYCWAIFDLQSVSALAHDLPNF